MKLCLALIVIFTVGSSAAGVVERESRKQWCADGGGSFTNFDEGFVCSLERS